MASIRSDISTGRRLYIQTAYGEPVVDRLKELGVHWDRDQRCWWISPAKRAAVEELLVESDRKVESGEEPAQKPRDPHDVRLVGKARYKGRGYYVAAVTADGAKAKLCSLPGPNGKWIEFWARIAVRGGAAIGRLDTRDHDGSGDVAVMEKTYEPREVWDGRRYSGRTRTVYTTLGSIADFIADQRSGRSNRVQCHECDSWHDASEPCRDCGGC